MPATSLKDLNAMSRADFVAVCGPFFECSPWIADRTWTMKPFAAREALHTAMRETVAGATLDEKLDLITAHPDLVGEAARRGSLTPESTAEQTAAGLGGLSPGDIARFSQYNSEYRAKFGFPFVICARENRKDAILKAFPLRLGNTREQEIATALTEIDKIARLRLFDALSEP